MRSRKWLDDVTGSKGELDEKGSVELTDGTTIQWYLWKGERPMVHSYAHRNGYIAALYANELYDIKTHHASFRRFGINQSAIRKNLTLIAVPPALDDGFGVYPDTARNSLRIKGTGQAGEGLPWDEWGEQFAKNLPQPLIDALRASVESEVATLSDERWSERLAERFSSRWKRWVRKVDPSGSSSTNPNEGGSRTGNRPTRPGGGSSGGTGGRGSGNAQGHGDGDDPARRTQVAGGVPDYRWEHADEFEEADVAAVWTPPSAAWPNGVVQLNHDFKPMVALVDYWRAAYPEHMELKVSKVIEEVYGQAMCARIAHSESLKRVPSWGSSRVEDELRSPGALTMAVLGLVSEDAIIAQRLGGLLGSPSRQDD